MKTKIFFVIAIAFISALIGCSSMQELQRNNSIRVGMTKTQVANVALTHAGLGDDPWLTGCYYEYLPDSKCEIISGSNRAQYLVFCGAYAASNCTIRSGNSTLRGIFQNYYTAKNSVTVKSSYAPSQYTPVSQSPSVNNKSKPSSSPIDDAVSRCIGRGVKPGTPEFSKCIAED